MGSVPDHPILLRNVSKHVPGASSCTTGFLLFLKPCLRREFVPGRTARSLSAREQGRSPSNPPQVSQRRRKSQVPYCLGELHPAKPRIVNLISVN
jgi:hypothetical protein